MLGKGLKKLKILPTILLVGFLFVRLPLCFAYAYVLPANDLELTVVAMGKKYSFYYPEIDFYKGEPYLKNAEEIVDGIFYDTLIRAKDATVSIFVEREYPFEFVSEEYGKAVDKEDLLVKIDKALRNKNKKIYAKEILLKPEITVEKLRESTYRRGFFSTNYMYSSEERKENIRLCAKLIGGVMLLDGQEFSFNNTVGERTEERGFKNAKIIEKGKFIDGIGGGVCQVSSTLYNSVLLSGLTITERHAHSMAVSYVEPSFDAMVSMGYADFKFINDSGSIAFLIAKTEEDSVAISVYGVKSEFSYKRVSEVTERIDPPDYLRTPTSGLLKGEERIVVYPKQGIKSIGYLEVYKNDKLKQRILLSKDSYAPLQGEVLYGESLYIS